jgi:hypothetical protein
MESHIACIAIGFLLDKVAIFPVTIGFALGIAMSGYGARGVILEGLCKARDVVMEKKTSLHK